MSTKYIINNSDLILPSQEINADLNIVGGLSSTTISATTLYVGGNSIARPYKVYTALLTQSGGDDPFAQTSGDLVIGQTYEISDYYSSSGWDFTNVGAPNNTVGTFFVATGTTPNSWDDGYLLTNSAAPSVTVLENTLGVEPTYRYSDVGEYIVNTVISFDFNKIAFIFGNSISQVTLDIASYEGGNEMFFFTPSDNQLYNYPIEIRVYN